MIKFDDIKVITFAKGNFLNSQTILSEHLNKLGISNQINLSDKDLPEDFKQKHKLFFNEIRGYGYWIWKPFIILNEIFKLSNNEILVYIDSTDLPKLPFFEFLQTHFITEDILLTNRGYKNGEWTKRDCFISMNCDSEKYHNAIQLEAGLMAFKKNDLCINLLSEWFEFMQNKQIVDDSPNTLGFPNLTNFKEHRHDQSILTNLSISKNIKNFNIGSEYVNFNFNQPRIYI
jgi:hypothetical protein